MKDLYLNGLKITLFLGVTTFFLVIAGWFLYREYILAITFGYLIVHIVLWVIIMIFTLMEDRKLERGVNKNDME